MVEIIEVGLEFKCHSQIWYFLYRYLYISNCIKNYKETKHDRKSSAN